VETRALVRQRLRGGRLTHAACSRTESEEIFDGFGSSRVKHLENDAPGLGFANFDIPEKSFTEMYEIGENTSRQKFTA
jgi:hypothetical protein